MLFPLSNMSSNSQNTVTESEISGSVNMVVQKLNHLNSFSLPRFVKQMFVERLLGGNGRAHNQKLIIIMVHAIMLDSGFVGFDRISNSIVSCFHLRNEWNSDLSKMSLFYALPEEDNGVSDCDSIIKCVVLKFQTLGEYSMDIYGTLENVMGARNTYSMRVDKYELTPFLNVIWSKCFRSWLKGDRDDDGHGLILDTSLVDNFLRNLRENIALPLLMDLSKAEVMKHHHFYVGLPMDLKLKILEFLPGADVAKASCASSEMRDLGSSDYLWKMKFVEEFGYEQMERGIMRGWKRAFLSEWERRREIKRASEVRHLRIITAITLADLRRGDNHRRRRRR